MDTISPQEAYDILQQKGPAAVLIDVCTPDEFDDAHAEGAISMPLNEVTMHVKDLEPYTDVLVICRLGMRSATAAELLRALGVKGEVRSVAGGLSAWHAEGLPIE